MVLGVMEKIYFVDVFMEVGRVGYLFKVVQFIYQELVVWKVFLFLVLVLVEQYVVFVFCFLRFWC